MYFNGQIVWDEDKKKPVKVGGTDNDGAFAWSNIPKNSTHFIYVNPRILGQSIALPETVKEAKKLLKDKVIIPAPIKPHNGLSW